MTKEKKIAIVDENIIKQKRGRKSKKDLQLAAEQKLIDKQENTSEIINEDNITCLIQEITETRSKKTRSKTKRWKNNSTNYTFE